MSINYKKGFSIKKNQSGSFLIELMISLVIGMLLLVAVTSFVVTVLTDTTRALQVTRLNQELRSLTEVISRDIKRSRSVINPVVWIGAGTAATNIYQGFSPASGQNGASGATADCAEFSYEWAPAAQRFRAISFDENNGRVLLDVAPNDAGTSCGTGAAISSENIEITDLVFQTTGNRVDISITAQIRGAENPVQRTFQTSVYLRSGGL